MFRDDEDYIGDDFEKTSYSEIISETDKAILFKNREGYFWIPKSALVELDDHYVTYYEWFRIDYLHASQVYAEYDVAETTKARKFRNNNGYFWIPKSCIIKREGNFIHYLSSIKINYIKEEPQYAK